MLRITTETELGKREMRSATRFFDFFGILMLLVSVYLCWHGYSPQQFQEREAYLAFVTAFLLGTPIFFLMGRLGFVRGDWELDNEKIVFTSLKGKSRTLFWNDVRAVRLGFHNIFLRGIGKVFYVILRFEEDQRREEAREFILERLGEAFDFSKRIHPEFTWRRKLLCLGLGLLIGSSIMGAIYIQTIMKVSNAWMKTEVFFVSIIGIVLGFYIVMIESRKEWRCRIEHEKSVENGF